MSHVSAVARLGLVVLSTTLLCLCCASQIIVVEKKTGFELDMFAAKSALFGQTLPSKGMFGLAVSAEPDRCACSTVKPPPSDFPTTAFVDLMYGTVVIHPILLVARYGNCTFEDKVVSATKANYSAVIVHNVNSSALVAMSGPDDDTLVPSLFIGDKDGVKIRSNYSFPGHLDRILLLTNSPDDPFDLTAYLLPLAVFAALCFASMLGLVLYKWWQDRRRSMRHRLPKSALKKLPIVKYEELSSPSETCVICLDDFGEGDKIRILPCDHIYHAACIDPWLVKLKRICPQCRKKVFPRSGKGGSAMQSGDAIRRWRQRRRRRRQMHNRPGSAQSGDEEQHRVMVHPGDGSSGGLRHIHDGPSSSDYDDTDTEVDEDGISPDHGPPRADYSQPYLSVVSHGDSAVIVHAEPGPSSMPQSFISATDVSNSHRPGPCSNDSSDSDVDFYSTLADDSVTTTISAQSADRRPTWTSTPTAEPTTEDTIATATTDANRAENVDLAANVTTVDPHSTSRRPSKSKRIKSRIKSKLKLRLHASKVASPAPSQGPVASSSSTSTGGQGQPKSDDVDDGDDDDDGGSSDLGRPLNP